MTKLTRAQEDPFEALENILAFWSGDWGSNNRLAWLHGIISGWNEESLEELQQNFGWDAEAIARLKRQHKIYTEVVEAYRQEKQEEKN